MNIPRLSIWFCQFHVDAQVLMMGNGDEIYVQGAGFGERMQSIWVTWQGHVACPCCYRNCDPVRHARYVQEISWQIRGACSACFAVLSLNTFDSIRIISYLQFTLALWVKWWLAQRSCSLTSRAASAPHLISLDYILIFSLQSKVFSRVSWSQLMKWPHTTGLVVIHDRISFDPAVEHVMWPMYTNGGCKGRIVQILYIFRTGLVSLQP